MPNYPHFILPGNGQPEDYTAPGGGSGTFHSPPRDRSRHAQALLDQLRTVRHDADRQLAEQPAATSGLHFIPIAFESDAGHELALESLENKPARIRVVNVKTENEKQIATVAVPKDKIEHFERRFTEFAERDRVRQAADGTETRSPYHQKLVTSINELRLAALRDYYMDSDGQPPVKAEVIWWEVWLDTAAVPSAVEDFRAQADQQNIAISENDEDSSQFRTRLTRDVWEDRLRNPGGAVPDSREWQLGDDLRRKECLHSDFWTGSASIATAACEFVLIPHSGTCSNRRGSGLRSIGVGRTD